MGLFRKSSNASTGAGHHLNPHDVKLTKEDREHFKMRTASVHDPILDAVQEAQPFEEAADVSQDDPNRKSYYSGDGNSQTRDVFGQPIQQPDISNPMRSREERPLDTIRGFEYSISGDPSWGQRLETPQYGFRVRPDFPQFGGQATAGSGPMPSSQFMQDQAIYSVPAPDSGLKSSSKKKKKRGLFGRKKEAAD